MAGRGEKRIDVDKKRKERYQLLGQGRGSGVKGAHPEKINCLTSPAAPKWGFNHVHKDPYSGQRATVGTSTHRSRNTLL